MGKINNFEFEHCGRPVTKKEIKEIQEIVSLFPKLSLTELSATVSETLSWFTASGKSKFDACRTLLERLEERGLVTLPEKRPMTKTRTPKRRKRQKLPEIPIETTLDQLKDIEIEVVNNGENKFLFQDCLANYHYLGYFKPFGCYMCYFIQCRQGPLGCILYAGAARKIAYRDNWIEWTVSQRKRNQGLVINNNRFLIFPWVKVKNLASYVLGNINRRICRDWQDCWNYTPVLMETFVDPERYAGTCYKAANWEYLGMTTGMGLARKGKTYTSSPKMIFVRPLRKDFRKFLCSDEI